MSPGQLRDAAGRLREAVRAGAPETGVIVEPYARNCNNPANAAEE